MSVVHSVKYNLFKNFNYNNDNNKLKDKLATNTNSSTTVIAYKIIDKYINDKYDIKPDDRKRLSEIILNCITVKYNIYQHDVVNYFLNRLVLSFHKNDNIHAEPIKEIIDLYRDKLIEKLNEIYLASNPKNLKSQNNIDSVVFLNSSLSIIESSKLKKDYI